MFIYIYIFMHICKHPLRTFRASRSAVASNPASSITARFASSPCHDFRRRQYRIIPYGWIGLFHDEESGHCVCFREWWAMYDDEESSHHCVCFHGWDCAMYDEEPGHIHMSWCLFRTDVGVWSQRSLLVRGDGGLKK